MYVLAIDPGKTGSASVLRVAEGNADTPISLCEVLSFGLKKNTDWEPKLKDLCYLWQPDRIVMEHVHAWARDGRKQAFGFGGNARAVEVALKFAGRSVDTRLDPQAWQNRLGQPKLYHIRDENERRKEHRKWQKFQALQLYPDLAKCKGDVFASVLIGHSLALDLLNVPLGTVRA